MAGDPQQRERDRSADGGGRSLDDPSAVPVVALGASAGGVEALRQLFAHLPEDTGVAFVVIQHLDPDRASLLARVLEGVTPLQVVEATSGMPVVANRVHVIPPGADLTIQRGILVLVGRKKTGHLHLPIDSFFRSLAEDQGGRAIGVVLSGSGADGTEGLRAIKAEGGITMAQEPGSAPFPSMPESALASGVVDVRGTPERLAGELTRLGHHPYITGGGAERPVAGSDDAEHLGSIFASLRQHVGTDYRAYKRTTVLRRIERRMTVRQVDGLGAYAEILREDPVEVRALARDMLIHVTAFFRDPDAFSVLGQQVIPELVQRKAEARAIRVWVPGCSTGEEPYSIAVALLEALGDEADRFAIQIFGTDLAGEAIEVARHGVYSESALAGVSPERLARYFDRVEGGYRVDKRVRERCVFVKHDLTRDPPFAKLDLIGCRNVLIYFGVDLQRRILPLLHHCLNERGYLFLGQSETITGFRDLFAPVDPENRIFMKTGSSPPLVYPLPTSRAVEAGLSEPRPAGRRLPGREVQRQADHLLLARYAPPGVVVTERLEIVQFRGRTGAYLEAPPGQPQTHLLRMVREGLVAHVHEAIERAKARGSAVRKEGIPVVLGAERPRVNLEVIPLPMLPDAAERYFLVLFEEDGAQTAVPREPVAREAPVEIAAGAEVDRLKAELATTKDYLQSLVAEHQLTTDDLAVVNEELLAANEELQSANEELQSAKEELQSTNEELSTVNDELRHRNQDLDQVAADLANVLSSVEIPIVIVDRALRVRRFTPAMADIAGFIPEDVGRPIEDLKLKVEIEDLVGSIRGVMEDVTPRSWEVRGVGGNWFRVQIRPYRTADRRLDGAVVSFIDVDTLRQARQDAESARDYAEAIVNTVTTALAVLDSELRVVSANGAFLERFTRPGEAAQGRSLFELGAGTWDIPEVRPALEGALASRLPFTDLEFTTDLPARGRRVLSLTGRSFVWRAGEPMLLLAAQDVTELRGLEAERSRILASEKQARVEAERATRAKDVFLAVLSHELRTPLSTILMSAQLLKHIASSDPKVMRSSASIERAATAQAKLIDDLLDISRIVSGKLLLDLASVDFQATVRDAVDGARPLAEAKSLELDLVVEGARGTRGTVYGDAVRLQQVVSNLLTNAIKFTPHGGRIAVRLEQLEGQVQLSITDTGMGIPAEVLPHLFARFVQADSSVTRTHGGLGLGLAIVRHLVEVHGGHVEVQSSGEGKGATFRVTLPTGTAEPGKEIPRVVVRSINGIHVLLVEDDDDTREAYVAMLTELGADVKAVSSAAEAMTALAASRPQVILSDVAMPGEDGFCFIERVRRLQADAGGHVPAAALTALASDADRQRALEAGFQIHVAKPVDAARLASVVGMLVDWKPIEAPAARA
jgi:two-component system, chemotaxis family, CheB/CheR fusion protein